MDQNTLNNIFIGLGLLAAVISPISSIIWSRQRIKAKDDHIKLLEGHINNLREFTPSRLKQEVVATTEMYEKIIQDFENDINFLNSEINEKDGVLNDIAASNVEKHDEVNKLQKERVELEDIIKTLHETIENMKRSMGETEELPELVEKWREMYSSYQNALSPNYIEARKYVSNIERALGKVQAFTDKIEVLTKTERPTAGNSFRRNKPVKAITRRLTDTDNDND